jgi:hypothetical protein
MSWQCDIIEPMSTKEERAKARANWPGVLTTLAEMDGLSAMPILADGTAAWDAVMELSLQAWSAKGLPNLPKDRSLWPSRKFLPGEYVPDSNGL